MGRALIVIETDFDRQKAKHWTDKAPLGTRIEFKASKRTLPQNDRMWAMLTDVSEQVTHLGNKYSPDQWKVLFMHACGREMKFLPGLDKKTFLPWGNSSSDLSKEEMTDLIEFILSWGAENDVVFKEPREANDNPNAGDSSTPADAETTAASTEDGGAPPPSSSPSLSPSDRGLLIECCAKLMSITVDEDLETPQQKRGVLVSSKDMWKERLRPELHEHLKGIFMSADAIIKGEADRSKAITEFAYWLECAPEEIGGAV